MTCLPFGLSSAPRTFRIWTFGSRIPQKKQYPLCGVSGRLSSRQSVQRAASKPGEVYNKPFTAPMMDDKLRQICIGSDSTPGTSRSCMGYTSQLKIPVGTKMPYAAHGITESNVKRQLVPQTGPVPNGETQLRFVYHSSRKASLSDNATKQPTSADNSPSQSPGNSRTCTDERKWWIKMASDILPLHSEPISHLLTTNASDFGWSAQLGPSKGRSEDINLAKLVSFLEGGFIVGQCNYTTNITDNSLSQSTGNSRACADQEEIIGKDGIRHITTTLGANITSSYD